MESVMVGLEILRRALSKLGPYALVEIVLPGGTLLSLVLYWYRQARSRRSIASMSMLGGAERP